MFCGNNTDNLSGDHVHMNKIENIAMLLHLRTVGGAHFDKDTCFKAKEELKETYVKYGVQCVKFDFQKEKNKEQSKNL